MRINKKNKKRIIYLICALFMIVLISLYVGNIYLLNEAKNITQEDIINPFFLLNYLDEYNSNYLINKAFKVSLLSFYALVICSCLILLKKQKDSSHGSAKFGNIDDLDEIDVLKKSWEDGVILGLAEGFNRSYKIIENLKTHIALIAPTRAGKGVGVIIPTLLNWKSSSVVLDLKGENYQNTAGYRQKVLKHKILRFAPHDDDDSCSYNPLAQVRLKTRYEFADAQIIADILTDPGEGNKKDHWGTQASSLLVAIILHVLYERSSKNEIATLGHVVDYFTDPSKPVLDRMRELMEFRHSKTHELFNELYDSSQNSGINEGTHPMVSRAGAEITNKDEREASSIISSCLTAITLYKDPIIRKNTANVDFKVHDLMNYKTPVDLYVVVEAKSIETLSPLIRLLITQIIGTLCPKLENVNVSPHKHKMLLMLDEFPAFGKIPLLEKALAYIAGYGMKAVIIAQALNQIKKTYGDKNTILENCSTAVFYTPTPTDEDTAKLISNLLGEKTIKTKNKSFKALKLDMGNISESKISRKLMTPEEVMKFDDRQNLIFFKGKPTYRGKKIQFFEDEYFLKKSKIKITKGE
ncbi:MAG: type IV secretory system conjugative DNA transfer family protein [Cetobacterium sp.]